MVNQMLYAFLKFEVFRKKVIAHYHLVCFYCRYMLSLEFLTGTIDKKDILIDALGCRLSSFD